MRFSKGKPFMEVPSECFVPGPDEITAMREDIKDIGRSMPTFSEAYLYPRLGKDDARFVLGVAEEYTKLIEVLGQDEVRRLLGGR